MKIPRDLLILAIFIFTLPDLTSSTGDDGDPLFSRPRDLDLIQSIPPVDLLSMKAPPRVLTLSEQPLDSLETDQTAPSQSHQSQGVGFTTALILCPFLFLTLYNKLGVLFTNYNTDPVSVSALHLTNDKKDNSMW